MQPAHERDANRWLFVLRPPEWLARAAFAASVREAILPRIEDAVDPHWLKVSLTAAPPPRLSLIPFRRGNVALISLAGVGAPPAELRRAVAFPGWRVSGYRAWASTPVKLDRRWPAGDATPGVGLLTLFRKRRGMADAAFLEAWHEGHTPLSLRIHPLSGYVRNVVSSAIDGDGAPYDGIVEEHFRSPADLLDPRRFFGGLPQLLPNMVRVARDIRRFIDLATIETYLTTEIVLRDQDPA